MQKQTLIDNLDEFTLNLSEAEKADRTVQAYRTVVRQFINQLTKDEFQKSDVIEYRKFLLSKGYRHSTVNFKIVILNKYFIFLEDTSLKVKVLKLQRRKSAENVATDKDFSRMLRTAKKRNLMDTYYMLQVLANSGIRVEELAFITIENLKQYKHSKSISVLNKGKYRDIFLPQWLVREILHYCKSVGRTSGFIFPSPEEKTKDKMIHPSTAWRRIQRVAGWAKINKEVAHPHSLRHLFAKEFLKRHPELQQTLADILGHENLNTTSIYSQLSKTEQKKIIDQFKC